MILYNGGILIDITIRNLQENESDLWDQIVETSPYGTLFHTWQFLKIVEKYSNRTLIPILGLKSEIPIAVYPIFYNESLIKTVFSPPPNMAIPYLGPVISNFDNLSSYERETILIEFQNKVDNFISSNLKSNFTQIISAPNIIDSRHFIWNDYEIRPLYNYQIDLSKGIDNIWNGFRKDLRQTINRTKKRDVTVDMGGIDEIDFIYERLSQRYKEQKKKYLLSKNYFMDLYNTFYPNHINVFASRYEKELIGGVINIMYKDKLLSWIGSPKISIKGLGQNDLTQWEAIKWANSQNYRWYEEIGANTQRLHYFKVKYNPDLNICFLARKYSPKFLKLFESIYKRKKVIYSKI